MAIVVAQAEVTAEHLDDQSRAAYAQLQQDFEALTADPRYADVLAATAQAEAAQERAVVTEPALQAAETRRTAFEANMLARMAAAAVAAAGGRPELLAQLAEETHAIQTTVNQARQAHETAVADLAAAAAAVAASAPAAAQMATEMDALQTRGQHFRALRAKVAQATDAVADARNALRAIDRNG